MEIALKSGGKKRAKRKRKRNEVPLGEDENVFTIETGPIGMNLIQSDDESCTVHTIKTGGQASLLGLMLVIR